MPNKNILNEVRSIRNNNPGNLRAVDAKTQSTLTQPGYVLDKAIGFDKDGFAIFPDQEAGMSAMQRQIRIDAGKGMTGAQMINKYAPKDDNTPLGKQYPNDPNVYIDNVFTKSGLDPNKQIDSKDIDTIQRAMVKQEGGQGAYDHFYGSSVSSDQRLASTEKPQSSLAMSPMVAAAPVVAAAATLPAFSTLPIITSITSKLGIPLSTALALNIMTDDSPAEQRRKAEREQLRISGIGTLAQNPRNLGNADVLNQIRAKQKTAMIAAREVKRRNEGETNQPVKVKIRDKLIDALAQKRKEARQKLTGMRSKNNLIAKLHAARATKGKRTMKQVAEQISFKDLRKKINESITHSDQLMEAKEKSKLSLSAKAKKFGVSLSTLKTVFRRGMAAWNSGHRPGTTPQQWGHARVNSYLRKGKTYHTADKDLRK